MITTGGPFGPTAVPVRAAFVSRASWFVWLMHVPSSVRVWSSGRRDFGGFRATRLEPAGTGARAGMVPVPGCLGATRSRRLRPDTPPPATPVLTVRPPRVSGRPSAARSKGPRALASLARTGCELGAPRSARPSPDACVVTSCLPSACDAVGRGGSAEEAYARSPETAGHHHHPRTWAPVPAGSGREARVSRRSRVPAPRARMKAECRRQAPRRTRVGLLRLKPKRL